MRTPKTNYFAQGNIQFSVKDQEVLFVIWKWNEEGTSQFTLHRGIVKDASELEFLTKKNITFDELSSRYGLTTSQQVTREMLS